MGARDGSRIAVEWSRLRRRSDNVLRRNQHQCKGRNEAEQKRIPPRAPRLSSLFSDSFRATRLTHCYSLLQSTGRRISLRGESRRLLIADLETARGRRAWINQNRIVPGGEAGEA